MFDHVQAELNELLTIIQDTAFVRAGLALDPMSKRSDSAMQEHARKEVRKTQLMEKYDLTNNVVYSQRDVQLAG